MLEHQLLIRNLEYPENFRRKKISEAEWLPKIKYPNIINNELDDVFPSKIKFFSLKVLIPKFPIFA